jgi:Tol biopolymer transport system component/tRNA A-37 threonylcarbamoyl transferase component Bud32
LRVNQFVRRILIYTSVRLTAGSRLGPYEIRGVIGRGGMGEVYRATDTRLNRTVAIKVLSEARGEDATMRKRFEHEARALSNLRHPHICALYDVGETPIEGDGSVPYLVMEYLEGKTLDNLLKHGPLPFDRVLRYGIEIAEALHKAHRERVLHRDLKPSNIMITENGASLLDFGLAKTLSIPQDDSSSTIVRSDTATDERSLTSSGNAVGTLHYMSPEQLETKEPDTRTDIFAFGVCLYQMATGRRPFDANSRAGLVASILRHDPPPPSSLRPEVPSAFDWVVKRCLAKDPDARYQSMHDVGLELQRIAETEKATPRPSLAVRGLSWWLAAVIAILLIGIAVYVRLHTRERAAQTSLGVRQLSVTLAPQAPIQSGYWEKLAVSRDGSRIAYVAAGDPPSLYVYSLEERSAKPLAQTENARSPFFSPDGKWIGFTTVDGLMKKVSIDGGAPIAIGKTGDIRGATWGENDQIVFGSTWSMLKVISANGAVTALPQATKSHFDSRWPVFLPDGKRVLFTLFDVTGDYDNSQLAVYDLETRTTKVVLTGATNGRLLGRAQLIYVRSGTLFTVPFDLQNLKVTGAPVPRVVDAESNFASGLAHFAVAGDGTLFYVPHNRAADDGEMVWVDRRGRVTTISPLRRAFVMPRLSPDGTQIVVRINEGTTSDSLWLYNIPRQTWAPLTSVIGYGGIWSPDGKSVAFPSNRNGSINLFIQPIDRSTPPRQITHTTHWPYANSWSPDGRELAVFEQLKDMATDIYVVPVDEKTPSRPFVATPFNENLPTFSPDEAWLAYQADDSGRYEIYVTRYAQNGSRWLVSSDGGTDPVWRHDGKELFYRNGARLMAVPIRAESEFRAGKPHMLFEGGFAEFFDVAADGSRFLMIKREKVPLQTEIRVISGLAEH